MDDDPYSELDNEERVYVGLHDAMMKMYANKNPKSFELAAQLITKASLPFLIRARCYMILSQKHGPLAVQYAETAVSLLDNEVRELVLPEAFPTVQFDLAHRLLRRAKEKEAAETAPPEEKSPGETGEPSGVEQVLEPAETSEAHAQTPQAEQARRAAASLFPPAATGQHGLVTPGPSRNPSGLEPQGTPRGGNPVPAHSRSNTTGSNTSRPAHKDDDVEMDE